MATRLRPLAIAISALVLAAPPAPADAPVPCPEIPGLRLSDTRVFLGTSGPSEVTCSYLAELEIPWPAGRLVGMWQPPGPAPRARVFCGDQTQWGIDPLIVHPAKAAATSAVVLSGEETRADAWAEAARQLLASLAGIARGCDEEPTAPPPPPVAPPAAPPPFELPPIVARPSPTQVEAAKRLYDEGENLYFGRGVAKDLAAAAAKYREAAILGHGHAQYSLGFMAKNGQGVSADPRAALAWTRLAAESGNSSGQDLLGDLYYYGIGVEKDPNTAATWYQKAAQQGNASGQYSYGWMLEKGEGVAPDLRSAFQWYSKAAAQNQSAAQYALGRLLEEGKAVPKNLASALQWYRKAADQGHEEAKKKVAALAPGKRTSGS